MHFWCIYVAKTIYALRPESFWAGNSANQKVWTFCVSVSIHCLFDNALAMGTFPGTLNIFIKRCLVKMAIHFRTLEGTLNTFIKSAW